MSETDGVRAPRLDERILVLVKGARDGELTRDLLHRAGFEPLLCATMAEVGERISQGAACVIVAEEILTKVAVDQLAAVLTAQPAWSDLPVIVFSMYRQAPPTRTLDPLGNVLVLDRPIQVRSMVASVHAALRSRRQQYEARRAIDARDNFLAMLGHELRNPLSAIRLAVTMLEQKWKVDARPKELTIAARQSEHLTRLVDDLLDVARVTHGKLVLHRSPLNVVDVVRSALETLEPRAKKRGLSCTLQAPVFELPVNGDRARLEQVFANLLSNAIKYTPAGGSITIEIGAEGESVVIAVTDTGIGLAPEMLEHVFDTFAQVEVSSDRSQGGLGLGLALVRSFVRRHSGEVAAASAGLGRGSTFVVRIPMLVTSSASVMARPESFDPKDHRARVVVVEDNDDVRELLQEMLEGQGHQVACAENGPHGVERILASQPDIAFVDLGLPEFDGLELARRVRAAGSTVRLIAVSGYGQEEDKDQAVHAGFDDHLTKPVDVDDMQRVILRGRKLGVHATAGSPRVAMSANVGRYVADR